MTLVIGGGRGDETAGRGKERNRIVWERHWLLGQQIGETTLRGTGGKGIVWDWYWLLGASKGVRQQ